MLAKALEQAKQGRLHILGKILETTAPRPEFKPHVPRIEQIIIPQDFIGAVIGPGGKVIQEIQKSTGTTITITEKDNKGFVDIFGENKDALEAALARIKGIVAMPEVGEVYKGKIRSIVAFGAFVEILPGKERAPRAKCSTGVSRRWSRPGLRRGRYDRGQTDRSRSEKRKVETLSQSVVERQERVERQYEKKGASRVRKRGSAKNKLFFYCNLKYILIFVRLNYAFENERIKK